MKIKKLSESVIAKIAAGEVIERPAYAIKELIENSIDAKSSRIIVDVTDYGLREIKVVDDGFGISKDDLSIAIQPHTTSKISDLRDLTKIKSMGFRGEALSSITSVSNFELKSKQRGKKGYTISNNSNKPYPVGIPLGTQVSIKNIFVQTPARKKFLSSKQTEYRHILAQFQSFALAHPMINFEFHHNGKKVYKTKSESIQNRIKNIFGEEIAANLFLLSHQDSYISIDGFISHPQTSFKSKNKLHIYVNGRRVHNTSLINAVKEGYKHLLTHYSYPFVCLFIKIPEDLIDVNVHPRKEIVKFINEENLYDLLRNSVYSSLEKSNLTFNNLSFSHKLTKTELASVLRDEVMQTPEGKIGKVKRSADIIQLHNLYLITETSKGILILDQHAVHEAILYYKFKQAYKKRKSAKLKANLKKPLLIQLSESQKSIIEEHKHYLDKIGFEIEIFGKDKFKLSSVPAIATDLDPRVNFLETLEDIENNNLSDIEDHINIMLSYLSCRSAIKSGDKLTKKQMRDLIKYLDKIDLSYTCPHGRPVKIEMSIKYLDSLFKRI